MNRITEITKRDIFSLFTSGIEILDFFDPKHVYYNYYGRLNEIEFLKRIYDLQTIPSYDKRHDDVEGDIWQHTINNDDWEPDWLFSDERFKLLEGNDEVFLKFLCEVFHPAVRDEKGYWKEFFERINNLIKADGYELYVSSKISGRELYSWRSYDPEETIIFIPFSQRHKDKIDSGALKFKLTKSLRNQIYQLFKRNISTFRETDETSGWNYDITTPECMFRDISQFYTPKCYQNNEYIPTSDLEQFLINTSPYCVFDAIEFYSHYNDDKFDVKINAIFKTNHINYILENGKIVSNIEIDITAKDLSNVQEAGLKDLIEEAAKYYNDNNKKIAVEKIWDAFERLKTYYSPALDKKHSVEKIIDSMSSKQKEFKDMYELEFRSLTNIGNDFRIRHHETTKIEITDERDFDYFYKRCLALISTAILYL